MNRLHTFETALALTLIHSVWMVGLLALLAALSLALAARRSAALRHALGMAFLLAMVVVPFIFFDQLLAGPDLAMPSPVRGTPGPSFSVAPYIGLRGGVELPAPPHWFPWVWAAGVILMVARLTGGWWVLRKLDRRPFELLPESWRTRADGLRRALGIRRAVAIHLLEDLGVPCSARAWKPVVWLPASLLTQLSPEQLEALLAHELAHIRRLDWIWNSLQCGVEALLFYHPGVWWLSRRVRQERELACDDLAVALCGDAIALAEALATLEGLRPQRPARTSGPARTLAPSLSLGATGGSLMERIQHLLSPSTPARFRWSLPLGMAVILGSGALLLAQTGKPASKPTTGPTLQEDRHMALGSNRVITDDSDGIQRVYHKRTSLLGTVTESYTENGQAKPIDAQVRTWLNRVNTPPPPPPVPPLPAAPPAPAGFPAPPAPPAPPDVPSLRDTPVCQAALDQAQRDGRLQALLGQPLVVGTDVKGSMTTWGPGDVHSLFGLLSSGSKAELRIPVSGPKGSAVLHAKARLRQDTWTFSKLEASPSTGGALNLLPSR